MYSRLFSLLKDPKRICRGIGYHFIDIFAKRMSDKTYLQLKWWIRNGQRLNLDNPYSFNEKLQWLKLNDRKPIYTIMVDKYEVKKYVANIIGWEYIIPTLAVYDQAEEIDFSILPDQFVLKCTHDSGGIVICKDKSKINIKKTIKKLHRALKSGFYWYNREWPYKNVQPRIIAEKYMTDEEGELKDYKFFCFDGIPKFFKVDFGRFTEHRANYYDLDWNFLPFGEKICPPSSDFKIVPPPNFSEMIEIARLLSKGQKFLRVDLYNISGKIYFGELTFYPASGYGKWSETYVDNELGQLINL